MYVYCISVFINVKKQTSYKFIDKHKYKREETKTKVSSEEQSTKRDPLWSG